MIEVILYTRQDCSLCDEVKETLSSLQDEIPHKLKEIDIDQDPALKKSFDTLIPVLEIGPYRLNAPITPLDLKVTLKAAQQRQDHIADIEDGIASGRLQVAIPWNKADRFTLWLSNRWLLAFNLFTLVYLCLPFLAPVLMRAGVTAPANIIYKTYSVVCHQFAFRSWFLFGEQVYYPREATHIDDVIYFDDAIGLTDDDLFGARAYTGNPQVGYKVALCQRDVAIYLGILMFGVVFGISKRKLAGIPWYFWILLGIFPIGLDGFSQLISQPPLNLFAFRESTPLLRTVTGWLFGFVTAWFGYPIAEDSMRESREYLSAKLHRIQSQKEI